MISCVIIEDQAPAQRILQKYIADVEILELKATFADPLVAFEYLKNNPIDVIFLDVHLPKISGIDFLEILPEKHQIILTTAFSDYALQGYELNIVDYLLKPFSFQRFLKAVTKVTSHNPGTLKNITESTDTKAKDYIFIKSGHEHLKIALKDILFIKSESDYTEIHMLTKKHLASYSLKTWSEALLNADFCQVHKSYIINTEKITKVSGNQVFIEDKVIPIGRAFKDFFHENYLNDLS
ncbi:response regulator [Leptobacterium flavescens]|uniref:Response regulator n=1 Tax=Leptobacterium flavescens TaxID=472055 RepID=A0A6P0UQH7_9FLAO|nr:LytTR family DNA-binding domain-containing protein [Leptobacterium flavescens]NER15365.1 response regulator [Leptobacterium flavescens]